jgi:hypothetical protein
LFLYQKKTNKKKKQTKIYKKDKKTNKNQQNRKKKQTMIYKLGKKNKQ